MSAMTQNLPQQPGSLEYFNRITKIVFLELSPARVLQLLAWNCQNKPETQAFCQILFGRQGFHMQSFLPAPSPPPPNPILLGSTLYQPCSSGLGKQGFILAPFGRAQLCGEDSRVETHEDAVQKCMWGLPDYTRALEARAMAAVPSELTRSHSFWNPACWSEISAAKDRQGCLSTLDPVFQGHLRCQGSSRLPSLVEASLYSFVTSDFDMNIVKQRPSCFLRSRSQESMWTILPRAHTSTPFPGHLPPVLIRKAGLS